MTERHWRVERRARGEWRLVAGGPYTKEGARRRADELRERRPRRRYRIVREAEFRRSHAEGY